MERNLTASAQATDKKPNIVFMLMVTVLRRVRASTVGVFCAVRANAAH